MKITYVGHAGLLVDTGDVKILMDPWLNGPAYCGQWHPFPRPVIDAGALGDVDVILLSHGHEDHLHEPTLQALPKRARVLYPYNWYGGTREYLEHMGFADVAEAASYKRYALTKNTSVTFIANNLDSIMVVESGGQVFVNANDSLHPHHPNVIKMLVADMAKRWPQVDVLFCGFGGASYFPNTIHMEGKDDEEVARLREQLFVQNFCRVTQGLKPRVAVPFAADFVLVDPEKQWINRARFPREQISAYYRETFGASEDAPDIFPMYPGDVLDGVALSPSSPYRASMRSGGLDHLIEEQYGEEIERRRSTSPISEEDAGAFARELQVHLQQRSAIYAEASLQRLDFSLRVTDIAQESYFNIRFPEGELVVERASGPAEGCRLVIELPTPILRYSFASEWGGDAITIGYACDIHIVDPGIVQEKLDVICVQLLTNHPAASRHMRRQPARAAKFLLQNPLTLKWGVRRMRTNDKLNLIYDRDLWLTRTKCEVCQVCDMPMLDSAFGESLS